MRERAIQSARDEYSLRSGGAAGTVVVAGGGSRAVAAVEAALAGSPWTVTARPDGFRIEAGTLPDVCAFVVFGEAAVQLAPRLAWRVPVIALMEEYDVETALGAIRTGAVDCVAFDQLERLPGILARESEVSLERECDADELVGRLAGRLLSPLSRTGRLDEYCDGLARALRATTAIVLVCEPSGEMVAAGARFADSAALPASIRIAPSDVETLRRGEPAAQARAALCLPDAVETLWVDLEGLRGAGAQLVARSGPAFSEVEVDVARRLAGLAGLAISRSDTVRRLRRNDGIKTEFVRTVSHELRTPLNTVIGYSDLLVDGAFGPLDGEQRKILRRVGDRARGLLEVIAATLELPGVDGGRVSLETQSISVGVMLAELEADAREWRVRRDLEYRWDVEADLPSITTDAGKLRVLLKNLIANATKFTDRGGITVRARARDGGVEFSVEDTGIGIEGEAVHFVFDAFRQASAANARQYGGVGLGLYIVRRLVGILGGRLRVESEVGVGSKFFVWVPADAN